MNYSNSTWEYCKYFVPDSDTTRTVKVIASTLLSACGIFGNIFVIVLATKYTVRKNLHHLIINMAVSDIQSKTAIPGILTSYWITFPKRGHLKLRHNSHKNWKATRRTTIRQFHDDQTRTDKDIFALKCHMDNFRSKIYVTSRHTPSRSRTGFEMLILLLIQYHTIYSSIPIYIRGIHLHRYFVMISVLILNGFGTFCHHFVVFLISHGRISRTQKSKFSTICFALERYIFLFTLLQYMIDTMFE